MWERKKKRKQSGEKTVKKRRIKMDREKQYKIELVSPGAFR